LGVLLLQSLSGSQPRRCASHLRHPLAELVGCELGNLDVAERGADEGAIAVASIGARLPIVVEKVDVFVHRIADGDRPMLAMGARRWLKHRLGGGLGGLPEVEHHDAVGVGVVVGGTDPGDLISLLADVMPHDPCARLPVAEAAVAEMKAALNRPIIRLPPDLEAAPCLAAVEGLGANPACPVPPSVLDTASV